LKNELFTNEARIILAQLMVKCVELKTLVPIAVLGTLLKCLIQNIPSLPSHFDD
jgi:hypothetical protein